MKTEASNDFVKLFHELTCRFTPWEVWKDFITMFACALSNSTDNGHFREREGIYTEIIRKYDPKEQTIFPQLCTEVVNALEVNPEQDFLGSLYMQLGFGNRLNGQFFTPYHVCEAMAALAINGDLEKQIKEKGYISICDPCCGAGATLIAGIHRAARLLEGSTNWQNHVLVAAQDVDYTTALMCYIQCSLLGAAGYVKIGNSFTDPIRQDDNLDNYWFTPVYFSALWQARQLIYERRLL